MEDYKSMPGDERYCIDLPYFPCHSNGRIKDECKFANTRLKLHIYGYWLLAQKRNLLRCVQVYRTLAKQKTTTTPCFKSNKLPGMGAVHKLIYLPIPDTEF